ncbi:Glycosyl hydrolase family 92 [compost metagenome]
MGAPLFAKTTLKLENGKTLEIIGNQASAQNFYVNDLKVNGKSYTKNWLSHQELLKGGTLSFDMTSKPNYNRGATKAAAPYSMTMELKTMFKK